MESYYQSDLVSKIYLTLVTSRSLSLRDNILSSRIPQSTLQKDVRKTFGYHHTTTFVIWYVPDDGFEIEQGDVHKEDGVWDRADMGDDMTGPLRADHWQLLVNDERFLRFDCSCIDVGRRTPRTIYLTWTLGGSLSKPGKQEVSPLVLSSGLLECVVDAFAVCDALLISLPIATDVVLVGTAEIAQICRA